MKSDPRVGIIGAGVNGIASALALLEAFPHLDVTVYGDQFSPHTTGDGSAGFWTPYSVIDTPIGNINKWSKITFDLMESWWRDHKPGVLLTPVRIIGTTEVPIPGWSHIPLNFRQLTQEELKPYGSEYISGNTYSSYCAEASVFVPELMETIASLGGKFEYRNIRRLEDISDRADIIINCSGIGSRDLVPDPNVYPIRGQVMRVKAPFIKCCTIDTSPENSCYIIPNCKTVVLGGTLQSNDWRTTVDVQDSQTIWNNCNKIEPQLKDGEIIREWVGLRPARKGGVRLEEDLICVNSKEIPIVHNYGHGGGGVTMFWGCALDVKDLVGKIINRHCEPVCSKL